MGASPSNDNRPTDRWRREFKWFGAGSNQFWLSGSRSNWSSLVLYVGMAGLTRAALNTTGPVNFWVATTAYVTCCVIAGTAAKLTTRRIRLVRICTAMLGFAAFVAAPALPVLATQPIDPDPTFTSMIPPLVPGALLLLISVASEVLCAMFPAKKR